MAGADGELNSGRITPSRAIGVPSPLPSVSLSREHITEAFKKSPDSGATLDLTHKNLTDVGEDGAEELANVGQGEDTGESAVVRIALAHNRLTTLPMAFALLARLRYLVLKNNNFTVFPDVLTIMPSLEKLDLSRNKIKRLPSQPGSLIKLRVFSLFRNKIHRLPPYFAQFQNLNLFKVDQNPLEWPPRDVMQPPALSENSDAMKEWIGNVQKWISQHSVPAERKLSEDSTYNDSFIELDHDSFGSDDPRDDIMDSKSPFDTSLFVEGSSAHQRSSSLESDASTYSDTILTPPSFDATRPPKSPRPPRLHLAAMSSARPTHPSASPSHSPDSYLPTPEESVSSTDEDATQSTATAQQHGRNASFAGPPAHPIRGILTNKKSLPDMRPPKLSLHKQRDGQSRPPAQDQFGVPSPPHRQESDSSTGSIPNYRVAKFSPTGVVSSPDSMHRPAPHMDGERHQYFRRISSLNARSLSRTIPPALLTLVDAIRGILFGVSQIYQALQHYTEYAIDERFSAVLLKVLDPASTYMNQLIHTLDRFDSVSRRTVPSPSVCKSLVEICRDNVIVFGKAVGVLTLQLKVLATHDDARYTRQMLLVLYGAMAEIAGAWKAIAGQVEALKPFLCEMRPPPASKAFNTATTHETVMSPPPGNGAPKPMLPASRQIARSISSGADARARMARRHAGSFSYKDVELGMLLPSNVESPPMGSSLPGQSPSPNGILRPTRRAATLFASAHHDHARNDGTIRPSTSRGDLHARQDSMSSFMVASASSSSLGISKTPSMEAISHTATLVDGEAVAAIKVALDVAPTVWDLTDELLLEDPPSQQIFGETLRKAKSITERLREDIRSVGTDAVNRKTLRDNAHAFANTVIQFLNAIRTYGTTHALSSALRTTMVKLSNATQDFVMFLHVSSFSPAPNSRPYSPMVAVPAPAPPPPPPVEDGRLGASLSRSRSAITSAGTRVLPPMKEPPRSALPHTTFMLSPPTRWPTVPG